jgi:hypothetical protein
VLSFHCKIYVRCPPNSLSPHPQTPSSLTSRPSTLYFHAPYLNSLHPHATICFPSRAQLHHQIFVTALAACRRRECGTHAPRHARALPGKRGHEMGTGVNRCTAAEKKYQMSLPCVCLDSSSGSRLHVSCTRCGPVVILLTRQVVDVNAMAGGVCNVDA